MSIATISLLASLALAADGHMVPKVVGLNNVVPTLHTPVQTTNNVPLVPQTPVYTAPQSTDVVLSRGDVFGLVTVSENDKVNGETVVIYNDQTLGIKEPTGPGYLFEALLLREYKLMVMPEPMTTVKLNDKNVFFLNSSMFNPSPIFSEENWELNVAGGTPVVCPSWNNVLVLKRYNEQVPCEDAIDVTLSIVPITQ